VREIKKRYAEEIRTSSERGNVVVVDGEGDFAGLPGVLAARSVGGAARLTLAPDLKPEAFLAQAIAGGMTIARFEAAPTPLEEIFVHVVTANGGGEA
jgi:ABC-type uncharacterized transport system ATPase subunit